ncbi:MAG: sensor histidine kinase [Lachnospiraceae bacterium]|jgi:two-component system sensor histidine kinase YesM|nr:sensor histidine kinase [Lachnospiraceae bacterium]
MLFKRLMILNTVVLFLLTVVFVGLNLSATRKIVENEVSAAFNSQMDDGSVELSRTFESARNMTLELCATRGIQDALRSGCLGQARPEEALARARDYAVDKGRLFSYFNTDLVLMMPDGTQYVLEDTGDSAASYRPGDEGYRSQELDGSFVWDYFYTDYGAYVRVSHMIYDEENWEQAIGIASVNINRDYLLYTLNSVWMGDTGRVYLLDASGSLLFPYIGNVEFPRELETGVTVSLPDGRQQVLYFKRDIPVNGYRIIGEARNIEALKEMAGQRKMILLIAAAVLGTASLMSFALTYRISTPILGLAQKMKQVEQGNFDIEIPVPQGMGEITILYHNFNSMLRIRQDLIEEIYGARVREKEAELRALQAQINPHFLYNTLDSINWMAVKYGADDIEEVVTDLSRMLRYSMNNGLNILKISQELIQIKSYIKIQQLRFSGFFQVTYDVDDQVLDCRIIKLLLQPLVENALLHGFDEAGENGVLIIRIRRMGERIHFSVINNGKQMNLEKVARAMDSSFVEQTGSYGLRNVNDRLVKYYGPDSGLRFSVKDGYSTAEFFIPFGETED